MRAHPTLNTAALDPELQDLLLLEIEMMMGNPLQILSNTERVRAALKTNYDWHTAQQLSRDLNLSEADIVSILENDLGSSIVRSYDSDYPNTYFYTPRAHYNEIAGPWHAFLSFVSGRIR